MKMEKNEITKRKGETHVEAVKERFPGVLKNVEWQTEDQLTITIDTDYLPQVMEFLYFGRGGWLPFMAANDERSLINKYALYYILSMEEEDICYLTVRAEVDPITCEYPSVTPLVPACVWSEREAYDMFGLKAVGLPDERRLVLPDDWPDGLFPLRKDAMDYRHRPAPVQDLENYTFLSNTGDKETTVIPMGPLHVTSDEPGHFRLFVEGEDIIDADYRMFYVHRGMEKVAESRLDYNAITFLADRICGICGCAHSVAYAEGVENAQGLVLPLRAQYIRAIALEIERLHSHLLNLGLVCHFTGFDTGFHHFFRTREKSMDLAEIVTGHRKTYGINLIGGVRRDILSDQRKAIMDICADLRTEVAGLVEELISTPNFMGRTKGVGVLDKKVARAFSPVGPCVRGSGFKRDVRFNHPFDGYKYLPDTLDVATQDSCDVLGRSLVRVQEFMDSLTMIEHLTDTLPSSKIIDEDFSYKPHKFGIGFTEAPRGEDVHWAMLGNNQKVYRWRAKAATYSNWPVLRYMFRGNTIADAAMIVGSMDPCYSCTDRMTIVDVKKKTSKVITKDQLEEYGRTRKHSPLKD